MTSGRLRALQLSNSGEAWAGRKPFKVLVCLPLVIHDVSPRPFCFPNIIIFSMCQYVKDFLWSEDVQDAGWAGRLFCSLWFVGGSVWAANGPECGGLGLMMGDFGWRYVNFFKKWRNVIKK